jgi:arylsulfatase A-like enzyme
MDRRTFISLAGGATAGSVLARASHGAHARRPNIVFILADDLGYADLACYGRRDIATPRIDSLARDGVRFLQAYSSSPVCSATRVALMTGRYQYRLPAGLQEPLRDNSDVGLPPDHPTLASQLRAAGYRTALVGKWHLGQLPGFGPLKSGYDTFYGFRGGSVDYYSHTNMGGRKDLWDGDQTVDTQGYLTDLLGDRTVSQIQEFSIHDTPFFLSVHFSAPHWPWEAPGDDAESKRLQGKSLFHYDGGSLPIYRRMVERMDFQVGRILDALARRRLARNTVVVFTSDNGGERFSDTWPFSGRKFELLEGGVRVPALMRWPGVVPRGRTSEQVAITMDWMPTLLAAAGTTPHPDFPSDGIDLLPPLAAAAPMPRKIYWRFKTNAQRAMRDGDFKLLKMQGNTFLFDVAEDPLERANLRDRNRDVYTRLTRDWDAWNATMLPEDPKSPTAAQSPADIADRYAPGPSPAPDDAMASWPEPAPVTR